MHCDCLVAHSALVYPNQCRFKYQCKVIVYRVAIASVPNQRRKCIPQVEISWPKWRNCRRSLADVSLENRPMQLHLQPPQVQSFQGPSSRRRPQSRKWNGTRRFLMIRFLGQSPFPFWATLSGNNWFYFIKKFVLHLFTRTSRREEVVDTIILMEEKK